MNEEKEKNTPAKKSVAEMFESAQKKSEAKTPAVKKIELPAKTSKKTELAELAGEGTRELTMSRFYGAVKARRRKPKTNRFVKALIISVLVVLVVIGALGLVGAKLVSSGSENTAEEYMRKLVAETDLDGWRQFLRVNLPNSYPAYAKPSDLAYKVLSPEFNIGDVTYVGASDSGRDTYMLFSDGRHFADIVFSEEKGFLSRAATVEKVEFDMSFFDTVTFPTILVYTPENAELTVNGVKMDASMPLSSSGARYPGVSAGELDGSVTSILYTFNDIYYVPELSATLGGAALSLNSDDGAHVYWFEYPEEMTHSITVVVPAEVNAYVGGTELNVSWASLETITGSLGSLDDGGTGTLPILSSWTVKGLFKDTTVTASYKGKALNLESQDNNRYVFEIPVECKYTVAVTYPEGAVLTINGKTIANSENTIKTTAKMLAGGSTILGSFNSPELASAEGALPGFKTTVVTGYLAEPIIDVVLDGTSLVYSGKTKDGYDIEYEFDIPETVLSSGTEVSSTSVREINSAALECGNEFLDAYLEYITCGGIKDDPTNRAKLDENHDKLISETIKGTPAYYSVMSSYTEVSTSTNYESGEHTVVVSSSVYEYSDKCLCYTLDTTLSRTAPEGSKRPNNSAFVKMNVLAVEYNGKWVVWAYSADVLSSK